MNQSSGSSALPQVKILYQGSQDGQILQQISPETFCSKRAAEWPNGTHIFYFPSIELNFLTDPEPTAMKLLPDYSAEIREHIAKEFSVPSWFWEKRGWDANGFFGSTENPVTELKDGGSSYGTFSRFLMKEVEEQAEKGLKHHWRYFAFCTLWFQERDDEEPTLILLCFDLVEAERKPGGSMHEIFHRQLQKLGSIEDVRKCPYGIHVSLVDVIVSQYNRAVWTFRKPVRDVERANEPRVELLQPLSRRGTKMSEAAHDQDEDEHERSKKLIEEDRNSKIRSYRHMHELSRHIIHASETLKVAVRTVTDIIRDAEGCSRPCCSVAKANTSVVTSLRSYASGLQNLNERSDAFYKRVENEITLAFHLVDAEDTSYTREILEETKHDGRELTSVVSFLSILFLPPTFTAGFFGMNFPFNFGSMKPIWMWAVISIILCFAAFLALHFSRQKRHKVLDGPRRKRWSRGSGPWKV